MNGTADGEKGGGGVGDEGRRSEFKGGSKRKQRMRSVYMWNDATKLLNIPDVMTAFFSLFLALTCVAGLMERGNAMRCTFLFG